MKIFFKETFIFALTGLLILASLGFLNELLVWQFILTPDKLKLSGGASILVTGDSHPQTALNPGLIPGSANVSCSAEILFYTYKKLEHLLKHNPQVKRVVVGVSHHNLLSSAEKETGNFFHRFSMLVGYKDLLDYPGLFLSRGMYSKTARSKLIAGFKHLAKDSVPFTCGYYSSTKSRYDDETVKKAALKKFYKDGKTDGLSSMQTRSLYKIIELAKSRGVELVLFTGPLHDKYLSAVPLEIKTKFNKIISKILNDHPRVKYMDYSRFGLDDSEYGDSHHANFYGAKKISADFAKKMN